MRTSALLCLFALVLLALAAVQVSASSHHFQNKPPPMGRDTVNRGEQKPRYKEGTRTEKARDTSEKVFFNPHEFVSEEINTNDVTVFSKSYCPYCKRAKGLLESNGIQFKAIELDVIPNGSDVQRALLQATGQRTVPNIFFGKQHIGGYDSVNKLNSAGELVATAEANKH